MDRLCVRLMGTMCAADYMDHRFNLRIQRQERNTEKTGVQNEERQFDEVFINGICNHMEHVKTRHKKTGQLFNCIFISSSALNRPKTSSRSKK